jgi:hypothetical protein
MSAAKPVRLQLSRLKGFNLQRLSMATNGLPAVNCTRQGAFGGLLGNPWRVGEYSREMAVSLHEVWINGQASDAEVGFAAARLRQLVMDKLPELRGKNLACTCRLDQPCHGDTLLAIANGDSE